MEHRVWQALVGLVLVAVLPLLIFGGGVAWMIVVQKKLAIADNLKSTTSALRVAVDHELLGQMTQVEILATDASLDNDNLTAFTNSAKRVIATNGTWFTASLIDPISHAIVATTATSAVGPLVSIASSAVDEVLKTRKSMIVGAVASGAVTRQDAEIEAAETLFKQRKVNREQMRQLNAARGWGVDVTPAPIAPARPEVPISRPWEPAATTNPNLAAADAEMLKAAIAFAFATVPRALANPLRDRGPA